MKMRLSEVCFVLFVVLGCISAYTLRDLFQALEDKENEKKSQAEAEVKKDTIPEQSNVSGKNDNREKELLEKLLKLLEDRKKAKQVMINNNDLKKTVTEKKTVTQQKALNNRDQYFSPSGLTERNFGPQGVPQVRNFGPQGGPDPQLRNFGPQGAPQQGSNLQQKRNFGMYGRELQNLKSNAHRAFGPSGLDYNQRYLDAYDREYLRTMIDEEIERLFFRSKNRQ